MKKNVRNTTNKKEIFYVKKMRIKDYSDIIDRTTSIDLDALIRESGKKTSASKKKKAA